MEIIRGILEITECYNISGSYDYLLKIHAPDMKYYQEFLLNGSARSIIWVQWRVCSSWTK